MKIIYNDRVIVPCTTSISCRQCVFGGIRFCRAINFWKARDLRIQMFRGSSCKGFRYENSI